MNDQMDRGDRILFLIAVTILVCFLLSCSTRKKTTQRESAKVETVVSQQENKGATKVEQKDTDTQTDKEVVTTVIEYDTEKPAVEGKQPVKKETKTIEKTQITEKGKYVVQAKDTTTNKIETNISRETKTQVKQAKSDTNYMPIIILGLSILGGAVAFWYARKMGWPAKILSILKSLLG